MVGHRGPGAYNPPLPAAGRCRRFNPKELDGFIFSALTDELVVDDVYLRVLVRDAQRAKSSGQGDYKAVSSATGLGQGIILPSDLLVRREGTERALFFCFY